jgi:hypothetical protein
MQAYAAAEVEHLKLLKELNGQGYWEELKKSREFDANYQVRERAEEQVRKLKPLHEKCEMADVKAGGLWRKALHNYVPGDNLRKVRNAAYESEGFDSSRLPQD